MKNDEANFNENLNQTEEAEPFDESAVEKSFSDFSGKSEKFDGEKIKFIDVVDKPIVVIAHKTIPDKFSQVEHATVTMMQISIGGKKYVTFTRSGVLVKQLDMAKEKMPFKTTIRKQKRYFTFT